MTAGPNQTHITFRANSHDIVGLRKLLASSDLDLTVWSNLETIDEGIMVKAPTEGIALAHLSGPVIESAIGQVRNWNVAKLLLKPIIARINALASTLDPNFRGVYPVGGLIRIPSGPNVHFSYEETIPSKTISTLGRHEKQFESLKDRWELADGDDTICLIMDSFLEPPTWNAIAACFENIEYYLGAGRAKLHEHKLMYPEQENEFGNAANNRVDRKSGSRHGKKAQNQKFSIEEQAEWMNLKEARELHRQVVSRFLDSLTGHRTAYEPLDSINEILRFGLDTYS